jgi:hypothetical protein
MTPFFILKNDLHISMVTFLEEIEEKCVPLILTIFQICTDSKEYTLKRSKGNDNLRTAHLIDKRTFNLQNGCVFLIGKVTFSLSAQAF